jgi:hypothetical protein
MNILGCRVAVLSSEITERLMKYGMDGCMHDFILPDPSILDGTLSLGVSVMIIFNLWENIQLLVVGVAHFPPA